MAGPDLLVLSDIVEIRVNKEEACSVGMVSGSLASL